MIKLKIGIQHGSCVDFNGKGLLILGAPRSGKSSLAIACMSIGATLVGDDYISPVSYTHLTLPTILLV